MSYLLDNVIPSGQDFAPFADVSDLVIGLHDTFYYNGVTINDLSEPEHYRLDDITGFEDADLETQDEGNVQEDGSTPGPGYYRSRTMGLSGVIVAGTYPQWPRMRWALTNAFLDLTERPLKIAAKSGSVFMHPDVQIYCRKADKILTPSKIESKWVIGGVIEAPFTISLKATNPIYESVQVHEQTLVPESVSFLGRSYDRSYDLAYVGLMDEFGNPVTDENSMVVVNAGNWYALPTIVFRGLQENARLVNIANGHELKMKHTIASDEEITVYVATGEVIDSSGVNRSDYFDTSSDWMRLVGTRESAAGVNELKLYLSSLDDESSVTVQWRDSYM